MTDLLRYDRMVERALRGVLRETLVQVGRHGLPGNHHLYITFRTDHPDVRLAEHLRAKYPNEMTIVIQYQCWALELDAAARSENGRLGKGSVSQVRYWWLCAN